MTATTSPLIRVGLDVTRASQKLREAVLSPGRLPNGDLLRLGNILVRCSGRRYDNRRGFIADPVELRFPFVEVATPEDALVMVPKDRIAPSQWRLEQREPWHLHVVATGIEWWIVVSNGVNPVPDRIAPLPGSPAAGAVSRDVPVLRLAA